MKKKLLILVLILGCAGYIYAQESEIRSLESFNKIVIGGNSKVYLTKGSPQEVKVETKNKLSEVETNVSYNALHIDGKPSSIYITIPELTGIVISGNGEVRTASAFQGESLKLEISGSGKILMPVEVTSLVLEISGMGKLHLSGSAQHMKLSIMGNGTVDAQDLRLTDADADISGVGKMSIDVTENLNMNISGVGKIYYKSEPKNITRQVSGVAKYGLLEPEEESDNDNSDDGDTTEAPAGNKRIIIVGGEERVDNGNDDDDDEIHVDAHNDNHEATPKKPKKSRSHWAGIDLGFNGFFTDGTSTSFPDRYDFLDLQAGRSLSVGVNIWSFDIKLYRRYIMLTTGIGLTLNNYRFTSDKTLLADTNRIAAGFDYTETGDQISYNKNKLAVNYITAPLLIQINTNSKLKKSFHIAAGMLFSYKYNSHLKLVYDEKGDKQKTKRQDEFNIEPFRYDATVRLGYRNYTIFASYAISELFKDKRGPTAHPFTAGIQLAGW
jgi:hypothetical protein